MVLDGLHYAWLTKDLLKRLDAWQARKLRRVLGIKAAYYSRVSNQYVLSRAGTKTFSDILQFDRLRYLGHILRSPTSAAEFSVCFEPSVRIRTLRGNNTRGSRRKAAGQKDLWTRSSITEFLAAAEAYQTATGLSLPSSSPPSSLDPSLAGALYARNRAQNRSLFGKIVRAKAPKPRSRGADGARGT